MNMTGTPMHLRHGMIYKSQGGFRLGLICLDLEVGMPGVKL